MESLNSKIITLVPKLQQPDKRLVLTKCFQLVIQVCTDFRYFMTDDGVKQFEDDFMAYFVNAFLIKHNSPFLFAGEDSRVLVLLLCFVIEKSRAAERIEESIEKEIKTLSSSFRKVKMNNQSTLDGSQFLLQTREI